MGCVLTDWNRDRLAAVAKRWETACRSGDAAAIVALLSNDAKVWYNFEGVEHDRERYRAILEASYATFKNPQYKDFRVMLHPGGFVEQATLEGHTDKGPISTPFCLVATVVGDQITRLEEYFDSTIMRELG
jgi:ketosteroid isomerase-like protein